MSVTTVVLDAAGLPWTEVTMPSSSSPVQLARLHSDRTTKASVSLVRFPPGWSRPGTGHYTCAEEFVVLEGEISVSGSVSTAGAHTYLPSLTSRTASFAGAEGCLAVAWFSGPPVWRDGVAPEGPDPAEVGDTVLLESVTEAPGSLSTDDTAGFDVLFVEERTWVYVPAGEPFPDLPGRVLVRRWARSGA